jgi:hypothetical protein
MCKHVEFLWLFVTSAKDPKLKAKLTKQAQDEKELLDKCVQIQERWNGYAANFPGFFKGKSTECEAPGHDSVQLVNITPMSLWFLVFITN